MFMGECFVQMLAGFGQLVLIMGGIAFVMWIVWAVKQSSSNKQ